jgi:NADPH:quinone reductase
MLYIEPAISSRTLASFRDQPRCPVIDPGRRVTVLITHGERCRSRHRAHPHDVARSRGADELIDYRTESIRDRVRALTDGKGADVVYDPVGGDAFDQALRAVNWEARMLVIGFAAGRIQAVPANLILVKNISVIGVVWGAQAERDPVLISRNLAELLRWWEAGRLKPLVAKVFPLAEAGAAMNALLSRQYAGKIVLET